MAIDPGTKRLGIAISDPLQMIASPYNVIKFKSMEQVMQEIMQIIEEKQIVKVIIGYPLREDGDEGVTSPISYQIKELLDKQSIESVLFDERYSSYIAQKRLQDQGISMKKAKSKLDAYAAVVILEDFLASGK